MPEQLLYKFIPDEREQVIELSNGRRAYLREDGAFETMDRHDNIDGIYRIVKGTRIAYRIDGKEDEDGGNKL